MTRLPRLTPGDLDAEQAALYRSITDGPRSTGPFSLIDADGGLVGPFNAMLLHPRLGNALQALGAGVRYGTSLDPRSREIAILVVAARWRSDFELYAHEAIGRGVGLTDEEFAAIRGGDHSAFTDERERLVADTVRALALDGDLPDAEYARAVEAFGADGLFELSTLVGYYALLALQLRLFRVPAPPA